MYNYVHLIGRLTADPEVQETESGHKICRMPLAVQRSYKNSEGVYETDFINTVLWQGVAERTAEYCHKGDLITVRGQLRNNNYEKEDGTKVYSTEVIVEKISFLSSRSKDFEEVEQKPEV